MRGRSFDEYMSVTVMFRKESDMQAPASQEDLFSAVVHAADGVRFAASARRAEELAAQVVGYIEDRCDEVLWPKVARRVRDLIAGRRHYAAIALYFAQVGDRWDEERLELDEPHAVFSNLLRTETADASARVLEHHVEEEQESF
jgi:hypothetical protein